MGILAGGANAQAPDYAPRQAWDPVPVAPSAMPGGYGGPGPQPGMMPPSAMPPGPPGSPPGEDEGPNAFEKPDCLPPPAPPCFWLVPEGLLGWTKRGPLPQPLASTSLWGWELNTVGFTDPLVESGDSWLRLQLFAGLRHVELNEGLQIFSTASPLDPNFAVFFNGQTFGVGSTTAVNDVFRTRNNF